MPREPISIAGYARFLERCLRRARRSTRAAVVGNSMGGYIAAELAIASPQRVERLMLVSAAGITAEHVQRDAVMAGGARRSRADRDAHRRAARALRAARRRCGAIALSFVVRHADRLSAPLAHELMQGAGKPGFLPALEAIMAHRISERLPQIACPTFVVWGEDDHVIPVRDAKRFDELIPRRAHRGLAATPGTSRCSSARRASTRCWRRSSRGSRRAAAAGRTGDPSARDRRPRRRCRRASRTSGSRRRRARRRAAPARSRAAARRSARRRARRRCGARRRRS